MKKTMLTFLMALASLGASAQLLYKISGLGLTSPSYIVGTYHLANSSFIDSIPGIRKAMSDCQQTYGEVVMSDALGADSLAVLQKAMMLPDGITLDSLLTKEEMGRLNTYMMGLLGMDLTNPMLAQMNKMTPVALSNTLSLFSYIKRSGSVNAQNQFDNYFQRQSLEQGKGIGGLETIAFQAKILLGGKSLERQKQLLMCQVDNAEFMDELADDVIRAFYAQDLDAVKQAVDMKLNNSCDNSPEEDDEMIYNRNADWLTKMPTIMEQKPTLFAVGAAHLPGERGVLNLLRQKGYTVEGVRE